ncbi:putative disease resistance RPP13-like protein 3 [Pistacia vera]|uniref:putative disease resistance RPP13-like protein 3 n=1 Tax=Pistacia vera TaxID=55513 RepID=UPI001263B7C2|nr:putative disease resistance RPP13-like protein 3 [Pistacia vera]
MRYQVNSQIRKIKRRVTEVKERRDRYGILASEAQIIYRPSSKSTGAATPFAREDDILGIDDDVEQIMKSSLAGRPNRRRVISVFGMGGLGKTTLVKEVYKRVKASFDCHSWVSISPSYDLIDVLKAVLFEFKSSRKEAALDIMDDVNEGQLQERTYRYLENKNYLLVVDDLWEAQLWDELKQALPRDRGLVIFTSRIRDIASKVEDNCHIQELQHLPHELARDIFCRKAFGEEMTCPRELEALTEAIIRRCEGLPLAIVNLAGHLSRTESKQQEMQSLLHDLDWEHNHSTDLERLNKVLVCSYNHLPYYLKYCFLYIGLFLEDYEIGRKRLIRMWVAEGFVKKTSQKSEEEVANSYFKQLIDRSMIQSITLHARDVVKACKLHNLMREVATQMFKEEKFGAILVDRNNEIEDRQRRLSVYSNAENIPANIGNLNLRSFLLFRATEMSSSALRKLLAELRLVRLLDLQGVGIESLPDEVGDLINLRYLDLRGTMIKNLPNSMKNLRNLQTLDIRNTNVSTLPRGINMLTELRHLHMASFFERDNKDFLKIPKGKLCFKELQTLSGIDCDQNFMKQLRSLTNLRKLYIGGITGSIKSAFEVSTSFGEIKIARVSQKIAKLVSVSKLPPYIVLIQELYRRRPFSNPGTITQSSCSHS